MAIHPKNGLSRIRYKANLLGPSKGFSQDATCTPKASRTSTGQATLELLDRQTDPRDCQEKLVAQYLHMA